MNVLIISPHLDDETLGAGGAILRWIDEGHQVSIINVASPKSDIRYKEGTKGYENRQKQLDNMQLYYNFTNVFNLELETSRLDQYSDLEMVGKIGEIINSVKPNILVLPDYNDIHTDHIKCFEWGFSASKVFRYPFIKQIMTMEIISETDFGKPENHFVPNYYIDITNYMDKKMKAISIYDTEFHPHPFPRSEEHVSALAIVRGAEAGTKYAEAFRLIKYIG